ncbi:hypothetical protein [Nannocystis bainbridge]|nr:hypothetical protein [Nannocystis bainbridge]
MVSATTFGFALPFVLSQVTAARPATAELPEAEFCGADDCSDDEPPGLDLARCAGLQFGFEARACEVRKGPACLVSCTFDAVGQGCLNEVGDRATPRDLAACQTETVAVCRSQCEVAGAAFCERERPSQAFAGCEEGDEDCVDSYAGGDSAVFVDLLACIGPGIEAG